MKVVLFSCFDKAVVLFSALMPSHIFVLKWHHVTASSAHFQIVLNNWWHMSVNISVGVWHFSLCFSLFELQHSNKAVWFFFSIILCSYLGSIAIALEKRLQSVASIMNSCCYERSQEKMTLNFTRITISVWNLNVLSSACVGVFWVLGFLPTVCKHVWWVNW